MTPPDFDEARRRILEATLARAPGEGWTWTAVERAAADAGFARSMSRRCFPRGLGAVIEFLAADADRRMAAELANRDLAGLRVRERIATAVRVRLEQAAPHRRAIRRALALKATPEYAPGALVGLARTVDGMWRAAGDGATDVNWYTKRALLAGVYMATLLYWLNDESEGFEATWRFLDRRIADVMRIQMARGRVDRLAAFFDAPLKRALASIGAARG